MSLVRLSVWYFLAYWLDQERTWHIFFCIFFILLISLLLMCSAMYFIFILCVTFTLYVTIVSIVWFKLLYCLLIYYSYLYHC